MTADALIRVLKNGGSVCVVGGKASNFDDAERANPRIVINREDSTAIPTNARYVVILRWVSHNMAEIVMAECRKRRIPFDYLGTGEMHSLFRQAFAVSVSPNGQTLVTQAGQRFDVPLVGARLVHKPLAALATITPEPTIMDTPDKPAVKWGDLARIIDEYDTDPSERPTAVADRLMPILAARGITSSRDSVRQGVSDRRRRRADEQGIPTLTPAALPSPAPAPVKGASTSEVLKILQEVRAGLDLIEGWAKQVHAVLDLIK